MKILQECVNKIEMRQGIDDRLHGDKKSGTAKILDNLLSHRNDCYIYFFLTQIENVYK